MARKTKKVSHGKEAFYIICILVVLLIAVFGYVGPGGYREMKKKQAELESYRARTDALRRENDERFRRVQLLQQEDPATLERIARQKGYARKNEIIQDLPAPESPRKK